MERRRGRELLLALIGCICGVLLLDGLVFVVGNWYARHLMLTVGSAVSAFVPRMVGLLGGTWIGAVLGCWGALQWGRAEAADHTARLLAILIPVGVGAWFILFGFLAGFRWYWSVPERWLLLGSSALGVLGGLAVLARWRTAPATLADREHG